MRIGLNPIFKDYDDDDPDIEFRRKRWDYWGSLKKIRTEYYDTFHANTPEAWKIQLDPYIFGNYVKEKYGIQINVVDGRITDKFEIIDEKLYTYFLLKHG